VTGSILDFVSTYKISQFRRGMLFIRNRMELGERLLFGWNNKIGLTLLLLRSKLIIVVSWRLFFYVESILSFTALDADDLFGLESVARLLEIVRQL
jgi:hypothetical protein